MSTTTFKSRILSAEQLVDEKMSDYAVDVAENKAAYAVDGLKRGYLRILWAARDQKEMVELPTFQGRIVQYHAVGDNSIVDMCLRMMQPHSVGYPLLEGKGNCGDYHSLSKGASRYLKVRISSFARDMFFKDIDLTTLPMRETSNFMDVEPKFLIPKLPMAMLMYNLTIGTGFKSVIFPLNLGNVCTLVQKFIDHQDKVSKSGAFDFRNYPDLLMPDFPIYNVILNSDEILSSYRRGNFTPTVKLEGLMEIKGNTIIIKVAPYGVAFPNVEEELKKLLTAKGSNLSDICIEYKNLSNKVSEGALSVTFKRTVDIFQIAYRLYKALKLSGGIKNLPIYGTPSGALTTFTPAQVFSTWFNFRHESIVSGIKHSQLENSRQIRTLETLIQVYDHWSDIENIIRHQASTPEHAVELILQKYPLTHERARAIINAPSISANIGQKSIHQENLEKAYLVRDKLNNAKSEVDNQIYTDAEYFKKKYGVPRRTVYTQYAGYIRVNSDNKNNLIQYRDHDEAIDLLNQYSGTDIVEYQPHHKILYQINNTQVTPFKQTVPPKYTQLDELILGTNPKLYTVVLKDGTESIFDGVYVPTDNLKYFILPSKFIGIASDGSVERLKHGDLSKRKTKNSGGKMTDFIHFVPESSNPFVLFYSNTFDPTLVVAAKITSTTTKILTNCAGETLFIGYAPLNKKTPTIFKLHEGSPKTAVYLVVNDVEKLMGKSSLKEFTVARKAVKHSTLRNAVVM